MSEIESLKAIIHTLDAMEPEARKRALAWATAKYGVIGIPFPATPSEVNRGGVNPASPLKARAKGVKSKRSRIAPKVLKELDLNPAGKPSFREFVASKKPGSLLEKCTAAVYYLTNTLELSEVSIHHVFTAFKAVDWRLPNDFANTLQQAGTKGWLDTRKSTAIKVTPMGQNLIEHDLPRSRTK